VMLSDDGLKDPPLAIGIAINLLVPFLGVIIFIWLCRKMQRDAIPSPPYFVYFILFATYGGWLLAILTLLFWVLSGMFMLGNLYLIVVSPFLTAAIAYHLRNRRTLSRYHQSAYVACLSNVAVALIAVTGLYIAHLAYS
jgi:hypothetical protein